MNIKLILIMLNEIVAWILDSARNKKEKKLERKMSLKSHMKNDTLNVR